jgi:SMC interacting uncharacterized protein involved in chromosome segregation
LRVAHLRLNIAALLIEGFPMATKVRQAVGSVERILLPRLNSIDGELKSINTKIDSANTRIDSELRSVHTRIDSVHTRIDSVNTKIDEMDKRNGIRFDAIGNEIRALSSSVNTRIDEMDKRNGIQFEAIGKEIRALSGKVDLVKDVERLKIEVAELKRSRQSISCRLVAAPTHNMQDFAERGLRRWLGAL